MQDVSECPLSSLWIEWIEMERKEAALRSPKSREPAAALTLTADELFGSALGVNWTQQPLLDSLSPLSGVQIN